MLNHHAGADVAPGEEKKDKEEKEEEKKVAAVEVSSSKKEVKVKMAAVAVLRHHRSTKMASDWGLSANDSLTSKNMQVHPICRQS